jgi:nicotinate-nucleotide pyrophosphorylase (carboxylating)
VGLKITEEIKKIVRNALNEDIGKKDITTELFIPPKKIVRALIICKEKKAILCGLDLAKLTFKLLDKSIVFKTKLKDGNLISNGEVVAEIEGRARSILTSERTALNFLSLLSGIATFTYKFKEKIKPYNVKIMDTRKTHPGLRTLEKYAVRIGGGYNHRKRLDEMILIKDNHLKVIGGIENLKKILESKKRVTPPKLKIEIEIKDIEEFRIAQTLDVDIIMLDNMSLEDIKKIVKLNREKIKLEISGNINLRNIKKIAKIGVDMVSVGALTHSAKAVDFSLEMM